MVSLCTTVRGRQALTALLMHRDSHRLGTGLPVCVCVLPQLANSYAVIWIAVSSPPLSLSLFISISAIWVAWFAAFVLSCSFKLFDCQNQVFLNVLSTSILGWPSANGTLNHGTPPTPHRGTKAAHRQVAWQCSIVAITRSTVNCLPLATRIYSTRPDPTWPKPTIAVDPNPQTAS